MLIAGRSLTEPAGLLPSSLPRMHVAARVVGGRRAGAAGAPAACRRWRLPGSCSRVLASRPCGRSWSAGIVAARRRRCGLHAIIAPLMRAIGSTPTSPGGEIGRRRGLKIPRRKACRFESGPGHQQSLTHRCTPMPPIPTRHQGPDADLHGGLLPAASSCPAARGLVRAVAAGQRPLPALAGGQLRLPARQHDAPVLQHARACGCSAPSWSGCGASAATCSSCSPACWPRRRRSC